MCFPINLKQFVLLYFSSPFFSYRIESFQGSYFSFHKDFIYFTGLNYDIRLWLMFRVLICIQQWDNKCHLSFCVFLWEFNIYFELNLYICKVHGFILFLLFFISLKSVLLYIYTTFSLLYINWKTSVLTPCPSFVNRGNRGWVEYRE